LSRSIYKYRSKLARTYTYISMLNSQVTNSSARLPQPWDYPILDIFNKNLNFGPIKNNFQRN
jgi:hypothetical protein